MDRYTSHLELVWSMDAAAQFQSGFWSSKDEHHLAWTDADHAIAVTGAPGQAPTRFLVPGGPVDFFEGSDHHALGVGDNVAGIWIDASAERPVQVPWQRPERRYWRLSGGAFLEERGLALLGERTGFAIRILDMKTLDEVASAQVESEYTENLSILASEQGFGLVSCPAGGESEMRRFEVATDGKVTIDHRKRIIDETALRLVDGDNLVVCFNNGNGDFRVRMTETLAELSVIPREVTSGNRSYDLEIARPVALEDDKCLFVARTEHNGFDRLLLVNATEGTVLGDITDHFGTVPDNEQTPVFATLNGPRFVRFTGKKIELWRYRSPFE